MMISPDPLNELIIAARIDGVEKFVVGAFIFRDEKLLIVKRAATEDFLPGLHEIPSGGVEKGETLLQALSRETYEETGLKILGTPVYVNYFDYKSSSGKKTREFNFRVQTDGYDIRLNPSEHSDYLWVDVTSADFLALNLSEETRACIVEAHGSS
jgi:8-oxo-dGTP diphosphatase